MKDGVYRQLVSIFDTNSLNLLYMNKNKEIYTSLNLF